MTRRLLVAAVAVLAFTLAACHPAPSSGSPRCDQILHNQATSLRARDWRLDCTPGFSNYSESQGRYVAAWTDRSDKTVWIWPNYGNMTDNRVLRKVGQHELGHVLYGPDEWTADAYSYCTLPQSGVGYMAPLPTDADCAAFR